jgi:hypothetical protein
METEPFRQIEQTNACYINVYRSNDARWILNTTQKQRWKFRHSLSPTSLTTHKTSANE